MEYYVRILFVIEWLELDGTNEDSGDFWLVVWLISFFNYLFNKIAQGWVNYFRSKIKCDIKN